MIKSLESISRLMATPSHHPMARMVLKRQRHLVAPHHIHHHNLWQGNQNLTALRLSIAWKYRWSLPKMGEWHHNPHMPVRHQLWKTCSEMEKSSLMEAVVTGPGWAILFYGWQSLGEGLGLGKVRDASFTLSGAISWVGKQALLSTNLISLGEGQWLITKPSPKDVSNQEDLDILASSHLHQCHSTSAIKASLPNWQGLQHPLNNGGCPSGTLGHHTMNKAECCSPTPITFGLARSWVWKWPEFSINLFNDVS